MMTTEEEVRKASKQFYAALNLMANGDASTMANIWSPGTEVTALHPIGGRQVGWEAIKESFDQVASLAAEGKIELKDQLIQVAGDMACEVGVEQGQFNLSGEPVSFEVRVTNIYRREDGTWKMIHHHTDPAPAMVEVLNRL